MPSLYKKNDFNRVNNTTEEIQRSPFRRDNGRLIHSAVFRRLQGKTQLFPGNESDFFRNRLTHSLEVSQIAKGIAEQINCTHHFFSQKENHINTDLVETAALAHDLGHPPFGHNGEKALDEMMIRDGGFEGNAQTLRILSKMEKKETIGNDTVPIKRGKDCRVGLNLTFRTLAAVLKYDRKIPKTRNKIKKVVKGYYYTEEDLINKIKKSILGKDFKKNLKTIECQIMDIADDIAYSTYDLEDAFKAEFICPLGMLQSKPKFIKKIAAGIGITQFDVYEIILNTVSDIFDEESVKEMVNDLSNKGIKDIEAVSQTIAKIGAIQAYDYSNEICTNGYLRTKQTSALVHNFMSNIKVVLNKKNPVLSKITMKKSIRNQIEVLKRYTYETVIESSRLKVAEYRGKDIVKEIFKALADKKRKGFELLPQDFRNLYDGFKDPSLKNRVICDFIAGMTDRYAVEFYSRLKSENPQTIFKPF